MALPLRVVLDGRWIRMDSGIGQYCYWLARTLPATAPDLALHVLLPATDDPLVRDLAERFPTERFPGGPHVASVLHASPRSPRGVVELARALWRARPAVYHAPDWAALPSVRSGWRSVATIHDLIPLVAPETVPRSLKGRHPHLYRMALRALARGADMVLTDTQAWAAEIRSRLGVRDDRVRVVPLGVSPPPVVPAAVVAEARARFAIGAAPYVLHVGRPEPYKGLASLIRAFAGAARSERLVIAGSLDSRYPEAGELVRGLGWEEQVRVVGPVTPDELEALYAGASAFATLSRLEGFGLSPLEAMARGVPVVASRASVFPETLGDAALLVAPDDEAAAGAALRRVLDDPELRARLADAGRVRAAGYTWERCAALTADAYRTAAAHLLGPGAQ